MDGHHLAVHRQRRVDIRSAAAAAAVGSRFHGDKIRLRLLLRMRLLIFILLLQRLHLELQSCNGIAVKTTLGDAAVLQGTTVKARLVTVVARTNHLAAANHDSAVAVVQWGLGSLLEAQREVVVGLHFDDCGWGLRW